MNWICRVFCSRAARSAFNFASTSAGAAAASSRQTATTRATSPGSDRTSSASAVAR